MTLKIINAYNQGDKVTTVFDKYPNEVQLY